MLCSFQNERETFLVRTIREEDLTAATRVLANITENGARRDSLAQLLHRQEYTAWVVETASEEIVGVMLLRIDPGVRDLFLVGVHPDHRGRGYGSALLDLVKRHAVDHCLTVSVAVSEEYQDLISLLERRGFKLSKSDLVPRNIHELRTTVPVRKYLFIGDLHNDPATWSWDLGPATPEYRGRPVHV